MKKETLEEARYRVYKDYWNENHSQEVKSYFLTAFRLGAKWQQEKSYSEEEVLELLLYCPSPYLTDEEIKEWFEQNKKEIR